MMKRALALPVLLIGLLLQTSTADALSFHEKIEAKPIKKDGQVVGLRLTLTLRPDSSGGHDKVRVGLGPMKKPANAPYDWQRKAASDPKDGYLLHQFPEIKIDAAKDKAKEVTLEVLYADVPGLAPGTEVEVVSAWNGKSNPTYWHVWGMQEITRDAKMVIKLPKPTAARKPKPKPKAEPETTEAAPGTTTAAAAATTTPRTRTPRARSTTSTRSRAASPTTRQRVTARRTALRARARQARGR